MPPPVLNELFPLTVTLVMVRVPPLFSIPAPPPLAELLPITVEFDTDPTALTPFCSMPPPPFLPLLPLTTELVTVRLPLLKTPPPNESVLLAFTVTLVKVSVPLLSTPPPLLAPVTLPPVMVRLLIATVLPLLILKTRVALLPLITIGSVFAPVFGPTVVRFRLSVSSPVVSVIVLTPPLWPGSAPGIWKVMVLLLHAEVIASRNDPAPLSLVFVTIGFAVQGLTVCETLPLLMSKF